MVYLNTFMTSAALRPCAMESPRSERSAPSSTVLGYRAATWHVEMNLKRLPFGGENSVLICPEVEIFAVQAKERFFEMLPWLLRRQNFTVPACVHEEGMDEIHGKFFRNVCH